ncbi:MAG: DUF4382 domain-containing protein [Chloroflexi bacterium]|nr:DUF4382 domain-containing protein [Chloroflexota bacterium]
MSNNLDRIFDECLDRMLLHGESVESCLAQYASHAGHLEPLLRTVARAGKAYAAVPTDAAAARSRQRLESTIQELLQVPEQHKRRERMGPPLPRFGLRAPGWATAAVALLLAVVLGLSGTVAASGNSLPGQALYPVKHTTEEVRLALEFSQEGKASLYLAYAERRAHELDALLKSGEMSQVEAVEVQLRRNVLAAAKAATALTDAEAASEVRSRLEGAVSSMLLRLEPALREAPEEERPRIDSVLQAIGGAYSDALETLSGLADAQHRAPGTGVLEVQTRAFSLPRVEKALVTATAIEAYVAAGEASRWVSLASGPQSFDLLRLAGGPHPLGRRSVDAGIYTRVRFAITNMIVVVDGTEHVVEVPEQPLTLSWPFRVERGALSVVSLDFNGAASLETSGPGRYILSPVVHLSVSEPVPESVAGAGEDQPEIRLKLVPPGQNTAGSVAMPSAHKEGTERDIAEGTEDKDPATVHPVATGPGWAAETRSTPDVPGPHGPAKALDEAGPGASPEIPQPAARQPEQGPPAWSASGERPGLQDTNGGTAQGTHPGPSAEAVPPQGQQPGPTAVAGPDGPGKMAQGRAEERAASAAPAAERGEHGAVVAGAAGSDVWAAGTFPAPATTAPSTSSKQPPPGPVGPVEKPGEAASAAGQPVVPPQAAKSAASKDDPLRGNPH